MQRARWLWGCRCGPGAGGTSHPVALRVTGKVGRRCCPSRSRASSPLLVSTGAELCFVAYYRSPGTGCRGAGFLGGPVPDPNRVLPSGFFRSQPGPPGARGSGLRAGVRAAAEEGEREVREGRHRRPPLGLVHAVPLRLCWVAWGQPALRPPEGGLAAPCLPRTSAPAPEVSIPGGESLPSQVGGVVVILHPGPPFMRRTGPLCSQRSSREAHSVPRSPCSERGCALAQTRGWAGWR